MSGGGAAAAQPVLGQVSFAECPLFEIIQLHECIRGELRSLRDRVQALRQQAARPRQDQLVVEVHSQFQLLYAIFQAHSTAEDETIWPALKAKAQMCKDDELEEQLRQESEYTEDHAGEDRLFQQIEAHLSQLRNSPRSSLDLLERLEGSTDRAVQHFINHMEKEETKAMPLIHRVFTDEEMGQLVGEIMGKRSADLMKGILESMTRNLTVEDAGTMLRTMRGAVNGTYFEKWLATNGFEWSNVHRAAVTEPDQRCTADGSDSGCELEELFAQVVGDCQASEDTTRRSCSLCALLKCCPVSSAVETHGIEALAKVLARSPASSTVKSHVLQTVRNAQWSVRTNRPRKRSASVELMLEAGHDATSPAGRRRPREPDSEAAAEEQERSRPHPRLFDMQRSPSLTSNVSTRSVGATASRSMSARSRNSDSHAVGMEMDEVAELEDLSGRRRPRVDLCMRQPGSRPDFSEEELAPAYRPGTTTLGCVHYSRACKLRAPCCGKLWTCRLCHDTHPGDCKTSTLDMYAVTEMLCMHCGALQPVGAVCASPDCQATSLPCPSQSRKSDASETAVASEEKWSPQVLGKYYCHVCKLWDNSTDKHIYHCQYCNVCRVGQGLGVDYRHCMKCNCCVELRSGVQHTCISQALEGKCPICFDDLRFSTSQLKGLPCAHVMHLDCYKQWRAHSYSCPVCWRSMDDMTEYFSRLDQAANALPTDAAFAHTRNRLQCNDCGRRSIAPFRLMHHKCAMPACGSYNTLVLDTIVLRPGSPDPPP